MAESSNQVEPHNGAKNTAQLSYAIARNVVNIGLQNLRKFSGYGEECFSAWRQDFEDLEFFNRLKDEDKLRCLRFKLEEPARKLLDQRNKEGHRQTYKDTMDALQEKFKLSKPLAVNELRGRKQQAGEDVTTYYQALLRMYKKLGFTDDQMDLVFTQAFISGTHMLIRNRLEHTELSTVDALEKAKKYEKQVLEDEAAMTYTNFLGRSKVIRDTIDKDNTADQRKTIQAQQREAESRDWGHDRRRPYSGHTGSYGYQGGDCSRIQSRDGPRRYTGKEDF